MADDLTKIIFGNMWNPYRTVDPEVAPDNLDEVCEYEAGDDPSKRWMAAASAVSATFISAYFGVNIYKFIRNRIRGNALLERYDRAIAKRIKAEPSYDVADSSEIAREAWKATNVKLGYVMIDAPEGAGMDRVVEKMIVMKEKGDPAVPEHFRDAPVVKFDPEIFKNETLYRSDVAKSLAGISRLARKGPIIVYIPNFDTMISENPYNPTPERSLFNIMLESPIIKNLIVLGTTSRKAKILKKYPDLQRYFSWIDIRKFDMPTSIATEMVRHPAYRDLMPWERAEHAEAMEVMVKELKVAGELHRFMDERTGRFLEGKFEVLAEASRKGGGVTMAELTKAAEAVEKSDPKAREDAERAAKEFAKEMAKKK